MTRPPKARQKVLKAARRIVETRGAGHLTFEMLAEESGVTRGGITYHFPTKEDLLKALIEADIADWNAANEELGGQTGLHCAKACRMIGHVRSSLADQDDSHKRFVTGMISAAMVDPDLLDPVRDHLAAEFADWQWDEADLERYLLLLAADGLFWNHLFNISPLPPAARQRLVALIEAKVQAFANAAEAQSAPADARSVHASSADGDVPRDAASASVASPLPPPET